MSTQKPIFLEDSIMRKGLPATAGSKLLQGFNAPFDAAVAERLRDRGFALESGPVAAEFGWASLPPKASAAVAAVADGRADVALFNDFAGTTGDLAASKGLYTIRPTYGTVSRYGLIPSVCSMDVISIVCKDLRQGFAVLSVIAGHDDRDGVSEPETSYSCAPSPDALTVAALDEASLPLPQVMTILASAELSGNLSRYDGVKFGFRASDFKGLDDLYRKTRTEGFSIDSKLALVVGSMVLSEGLYQKRYHKAMQIRRKLYDQMNALLADADVLTVPPSIKGGSLLAPLCGLPSVTLPDGTRLLAARKRENVLCAAAERGNPV